MKQFLFCCILLGVTVVAFAQEVQLDRYSADQVTIYDERNRRTSKVYLEKDKMRSEVDMGPAQVVTVVRLDEKIVYVMLPTAKLFVEKPLVANDGLLLRLADKDTPRELVGSETVQGRSYDKYKMTANGGVFYLWVDKSTRLPVQIVSADNRTRIENIQVGPQPADLFKPPPDYQKFVGNQLPAQ
jgi:hypothetical protein